MVYHYVRYFVFDDGTNLHVFLSFFNVYGVNVLQSCRWSLVILYFNLCFTVRFVYYKHSKYNFVQVVGYEDV